MNHSCWRFYRLSFLCLLCPSSSPIPPSPSLDPLPLFLQRLESLWVAIAAARCNFRPHSHSGDVSAARWQSNMRTHDYFGKQCTPRVFHPVTWELLYRPRLNFSGRTFLLSLAVLSLALVIQMSMMRCAVAALSPPEPIPFYHSKEPVHPPCHFISFHSRCISAAWGVTSCSAICPPHGKHSRS